jgi:ABC-type nitrate/sulfonate/bicarbonate transport system permease component
VTSPPKGGAPPGSSTPPPAGAPASAPSPKPGAPGAPRVAAIPQPPPWYRRLRTDPPLPIGPAIGAAFIGLVVLAWWFITRGSPTEAFISPSKLPSPGAVFGAFGALLDEGLVDSLISTLARVFTGVGLAALVGISLGVAAGAHRGIGAAVGPLVVFLRSIPMGALLPLMLVMFETGEKQKVMFLFFAIVAFVFSDTVKAVSLVPQRYVETAQTLGGGNLQIIFKVLVPLALPDILTSLRFQVGLALGYVTLAESIGSAADTGIGHMLNINQVRGLIEQNYLLLFIIAGVAYGIDLLIRSLQAGLFRWRQDL